MAFNIFATATSDIPLANLDANFTLIGAAAAVSTLYPTASTSITYGTAGTTHYLSGTGLAVAGAATVGTTLGVTGATTLSSTLGVTGAITGTGGNWNNAWSSAGSVVDVGANNTSTAASSNARLLCNVTATSTGDPTLLLSITGTKAWSVGIDNSNSDIFCISEDGVPGTTDRLQIAAGGAVTIPGTLGVGGAAVGFGNGYNEITIATGANGAMLYLQGTGPLNHRFYGNGSGISYDASGATAHTFYNNSVNTVTIASNGSFQSSPPATAGAINLDLYNIAGNESDHIYAMFRLANGTSIGSIRQVTTTSAVVYNTTSDYRIKDLFGSFTTAREMLSALTVHDGQFKGSEHRIPVLVAHEVQAVTPWAVMGEKDAVDDEGAPVYQQMGTGAHEALLIAGWQDHEARLASLQADFQSYKNSHP